MSPEQLGPLIAIAIALPLILLRNRKPRTLRPQWMWVMPLIITILIGFGLWGMSVSDPQHAAFDAGAWAILALGLLLGAGFGWWRGKMVTILIGFGLWGMSVSDPDHAAFDAGAWAILALGLVLGAGFGWWRGKMVTIHKDPDGVLKAQASPLGLILIIALMLGRSALRPWIEANAASWHVNPLAVVDAFMLFVVGVVILQRVEMWIRARRIQAGGSDEHLEASA